MRIDGASGGSGSRPGLDRRQLLKIGAWSAPAVVLATAAPAAAASHETGTIPVAQINLFSYGIQEINAGGEHLGPINWSGGRIEYTGQWDDPPTGTVAYSVIATGPGGFSQVLHPEDVAVIALYGNHALAGVIFGTAPMAPGTYTVTTTAVGSDGSRSVQESVTLE